MFEGFDEAKNLSDALYRNGFIYGYVTLKLRLLSGISGEEFAEIEEAAARAFESAKGEEEG